MAELISIITPVYNSEKYIAETIESVLAQTYPDWEMIVVDDCSTDSTPSILKSYSLFDPRVRLMRNPVNKGLPYSLNHAIGNAKGEFIARMDADDISLSTRFQKQIDFLNEHSEVEICGTGCIEIDRTGKEIFYKSMPCTEREIEKVIFKRSPFIHPTVMIRKSFFQEVGLYNESYLKTQDLELWSRAYISGVKMANLPDYLLLYRVENNFWGKRSSTLAIRNETRIIRYLIRNTGKYQLYFTVLMPKVLFRLSQRWLPAGLNQRIYNYLRKQVMIL